MELIDEGEQSLILRDRPSLFKSLFILIWALFFIGIPGALLLTTVSAVGTTRLICQRTEPEQLSCEIAQTRLLGLVKQSKQKYSKVKQAQFSQSEQIDHEGNELQDYWVALETSKGLITLFEDSIRYNGIRGSEMEMLSLADEINAFIQSKEPSFRIERDLSKSPTQLLFPVLFVSIFMMIGISVVVLTFQMRIAQFDRDRDRLHWKQYSLLGIKTKSIPFDEIMNIIIETNHDSDGVSSYRLYLESQGRDRIQLGMTHWQKQARRIQSKLQDFLQLEVRPGKS